MKWMQRVKRILERRRKPPRPRYRSSLELERVRDAALAEHERQKDMLSFWMNPYHIK